MGNSFISDEASFRELVKQYETVCRKVALALTGSLDAADDVVQSVFISIWARRENLSIQGDVKKYLIAAIYRQVQNQRRSYYRSEKRNEDWGAASVDDKTSDNIKQDLLIDINKALDELPERTALIFRLLWVEQLSYDEVATIAGISVKGVERARERAMKHLAVALRAYRHE